MAARLGLYRGQPGEQPRPGRLLPELSLGDKSAHGDPQPGRGHRPAAKNAPGLETARQPGRQTLAGRKTMKLAASRIREFRRCI